MKRSNKQFSTKNRNQKITVFLKIFASIGCRKKRKPVPSSLRAPQMDRPAMLVLSIERGRKNRLTAFRTDFLLFHCYSFIKNIKRSACILFLLKEKTMGD
ncbi:MAG: hypothetical protein A2934_05790 [Candidatus Sungbacteria bacterium RIFCSPLOWO2_01_FULL_47_10]|uniref:Uncharacterized protein n=1 Tax=Candidatus Sungbacteria bacterium RIFCSPLOWO2_01_FULL_47_10 TaxID=1802276 RepID=A0A1G2L9X9_9BACT|nr:MAG: hypothetical protein A2934_05790 [Candidatus Sungbacteria bacterium RIFCSPLOWO2_01_FULL_47_10]